ncbi:MAG: orotidine-5'-phosphate decarboxylase [Oligoflexia bacterium]|nr:orotidine-5'-phosphate decarboxylase [Oligoflexia bacterium]
MKKLPLFIALDLERKDLVLSIVEKTQDYAQAYKIGPRLFLIYGKALIEDIKKRAPDSQIFLDFKFYDIPSSTVEAVQSAFQVGADFVTVHACVGEETLQPLYQLERQLSQERAFRILFVTVLSSVASSLETESLVLSLADSVYKTGLRGLVCSPLEAKTLRSKYPDVFLVTPGIRLEGDSKGDQKRVMSPLEALQAGSSAVVMGRSLISQSNLESVLNKLYCLMEK